MSQAFAAVTWVTLVRQAQP